MKDDNVYIKKENGRYEPIGYQYNRDWLGDGIWSVHHSKGCTSIRNLSYYGQIYKVGDIKYPDLSKLAGMLHFSDLVLQSDKVQLLMHKACNFDEIVNTILAEAINISEDLENKSKKLPLRLITEENLRSDGFTKNTSAWEKVIDGTWYKVRVKPYSSKSDKNSSRFYSVVVNMTYDNTKVAEFRAEYMHQIYNLVNNL